MPSPPADVRFSHHWTASATLSCVVQIDGTKRSRQSAVLGLPHIAGPACSCARGGLVRHARGLLTPAGETAPSADRPDPVPASSSGGRLPHKRCTLASRASVVLQERRSAGARRSFQGRDRSRERSLCRRSRSGILLLNQFLRLLRPRHQFGIQTYPIGLQCHPTSPAAVIASFSRASSARSKAASEKKGRPVRV